MATNTDTVTDAIQSTIKAVMDTDPRFYSFDSWPAVRSKMIAMSPGLERSLMFQDLGRLSFMRILIEHMEAQKAATIAPASELVD